MKSVHASSKAGPIKGLGAMYSTHYEASLIKQDAELYASIKELGGADLITLLDHDAARADPIAVSDRQLGTGAPLCTGRIHSIIEGGAKLRLIAIGDY